MESQFRRLPGVDKLLADDRIKQIASSYPHERMVNLARQQLERERMSITSGKQAASYDDIVRAMVNSVQNLATPGLRHVINATGVILHTNLGRAPLSREAVDAMQAVSRGYSNLEFDIDSGERGSRDVHVEPLLCELTGAEAALVVNNNASAVMLALTALARRKEVIVSRGQAVEIGGGFRIPDVMRQSGARLVEVGATNCTYITDYEQAITPQTAALLRVHSSNFKVVGFTSDVTVDDLVNLGNRRGIPVLDDLGSGCFLDTTAFGLAAEPQVQVSITRGVALVLFSADKLVGGPQAGIIAGRKEYIAKLKKHPLARAVRIDKIRLAGLVVTLQHYLKGEALTRIPVWQMISASLADIGRRAQQWVDIIGETAEVIDGESMVGGGSLPGGTLPTKLVAVGSKKDKRLVQNINRRLRQSPVPVIGRIENDVLLLDPRSVLTEEDEIVVRELKTVSVSLK